MKRVLDWVAGWLTNLFEGTYSSGAESCDYMTRLEPVRVTSRTAIETRRARKIAKAA